MTIEKKDIPDLDPRIRRSIRTHGDEMYNVFVDTDDDNVVFGPSHNLAGHFIVLYPNESYINATLVLATEWSPDAINSLIDKFEQYHLPTTGLGSKPRTGQFGISVFTDADEMLFDLHNMDRLTPEPDRIDHLDSKMQKTQELLHELPETIENTVDNTIAKEYDNIKEIIESERDPEEKKSAIQQQVRVGLERGLPTAIYEFSTDEENNS